eukprot:GHVU01233145.1.p1 GENE.GHVU01233145.1~~GHVU01233145.1.p1  ORF type:complete len:118 (+),score=34.44 GHVU01233145.1:3-356(+)
MLANDDDDDDAMTMTTTMTRQQQQSEVTAASAVADFVPPPRRGCLRLPAAGLEAARGSTRKRVRFVEEVRVREMEMELLFREKLGHAGPQPNIWADNGGPGLVDGEKERRRECDQNR